MIVKSVVISPQGKDQLARLKAKTGIDQWNILCRWALCFSLREPTVPAEVSIPTEGGITIEWHTFAGEYHELYEALVIQRCVQDGLETDAASLAKWFRLHLHRGIAYLAATNFIKSSADLIRLVLEERSSLPTGEVDVDAALSGL